MKICMKALKNSDLWIIVCWKMNFLNAPFNENEVLSVLGSLKSGKAAGPDCLINEFVSLVNC